MKPRYVLALDQGTTSSRAIVFGEDGLAVASAQREFAQHYPQPGWVEHEPMDLWATQQATAAEALAKAGLGAGDVAAIGIANQRETTLLWDRHTGQPVARAMVWQDRRTAAACARWRADEAEAWITERTGLRLDPYFSASKLRWLLDNVPGARARAERGDLLFGTVDTWLIWKLTGGKVHATDVTNASRTLLLNLHTGQWDDELLAFFGIPAAVLPEVKTCSEVYGQVAPNQLPGGVPIAGVAGDQQAALFGQACFAPGLAKNTYGTGCFLLLHTGDRPVVSRHQLLSTIAWQIGSRREYALEGSVFVGGAVVQWLRDELQLIRDARELDMLAASVPDAGGLFLVPAFAGLGAPHWDAEARGLAIGITRGTTRAHFCRAALESIAFQTADLLTAMEQDAGLGLRELRVDGGAARSAPLLQFQADLLGRAVVRPRQIETTALGAAYLAGLAVGFWPDQATIARQWAVDTRYEPAGDGTALAAQRAAWTRAVARSREWAGEGKD